MHFSEFRVLVYSSNMGVQRIFPGGKNIFSRIFSNHGAKLKITEKHFNAKNE